MRPSPRWTSSPYQRSPSESFTAFLSLPMTGDESCIAMSQSIRTSAWVIQQRREAFPYDSAPGYLIFDRGAQFNEEVIETIRSFDIKPKRTGFRSPWRSEERRVGKE